MMWFIPISPECPQLRNQRFDFMHWRYINRKLLMVMVGARIGLGYEGMEIGV